MDLVSGGLILAFCVAGALVAYFADNLGRTLGKKRLSLLGMRPRHTATLITTTAGFFVPLITVILLAAASNEIRTILREGSRLRSDRDALRVEVSNTKRQVDDKTKIVTNLESQQTKSQQRLEQARKDLIARQKSIQVLIEQAGNLRKRTLTLQDTVKRAQGLLTSLQVRAKLLDSRNKELTGRNTEIERSYQIQRTQLQDAYRKYDTMVLDLEKLEASLKKIEADKVLAEQDLASQRKTFDALEQEFARKVADYQQRIVEQESKIADQTRALLQLAEVSDAALISRTRDKIFTINEEVTRLVVRAALTYPEANGVISNILKQAQEEAKNRGAGNVPGLGYAGFQERRFDTQILTSDQQIAMLREDLVRQSDAQVIIVTAVWNTFRGESVPLRYEMASNRLIYRAADVISEVRMNGTASDEQVEEDLTKWLVERVPTKIAADGVLPFKGRPVAYGELTRAQLRKLVRSVRDMNRITRVQMVAKRDTYAAGPLDVEYRLR